jgi:glycosyltransferase involved in cell wall biosynthesis
MFNGLVRIFATGSYIYLDDAPNRQSQATRTSSLQESHMHREQPSLSGGRRTKHIQPIDSGERPLLTVVTVVFNGCEALEATILSVLKQSYGNVEYIVIDGGSSDGTLDIIRKHEDAIDYWLTETDKGVYDAFNKACPLVTGEWTLFLGAGDVLYDEGVLEKIACATQAAPPETELIYGRVCLTTGNDTAVQVLNRPWDQMRNRWRGGRPMLPHHQGIFHRKSLLSEGLPFDTKYRIAADSKLVYGSLGRAMPVYCDTIITRAPIGGVSTEPKYFIPTAHEILRINHELGYKNYAHQLWFYLKILVKSLIYRLGGEAHAKRLIDEYRVLTGRKPHWRS